PRGLRQRVGRVRQAAQGRMADVRAVIHEPLGRADVAGAPGVWLVEQGPELYRSEAGVVRRPRGAPVVPVLAPRGTVGQFRVVARPQAAARTAPGSPRAVPG